MLGTRIDQGETYDQLPRTGTSPSTARHLYRSVYSLWGDLVTDREVIEALFRHYTKKSKDSFYTEPERTVYRVEAEDLRGILNGTYNIANIDLEAPPEKPSAIGPPEQECIILSWLRGENVTGTYTLRHYPNQNIWMVETDSMETALRLRSRLLTLSPGAPVRRDINLNFEVMK